MAVGSAPSSGAPAIGESAGSSSIAIAVSMIVSLTTTPMVCAHPSKETRPHGWMYRTSARAFDWVVNLYRSTLAVALRFRAITLVVLLASDRL
jgi:multidrug efflux pump